MYVTPGTVFCPVGGGAVAVMLLALLYFAHAVSACFAHATSTTAAAALPAASIACENVSQPLCLMLLCSFCSLVPQLLVC